MGKKRLAAKDQGSIGLTGKSREPFRSVD